MAGGFAGSSSGYRRPGSTQARALLRALRPVADLRLALPLFRAAVFFAVAVVVLRFVTVFFVTVVRFEARLAPPALFFLVVAALLAPDDFATCFFFRAELLVARFAVPSLSVLLRTL